MSLKDKQIIVTRAAHQSEELVDLLKAEGAEPLLFPCIDVEPPENLSILNNTLRTIGHFDWLILTSQNTVLALKKYLQQTGREKTAFAELQIAAVGERTAQAAQEHLSLNADIVPEQQSAEGLAAALPDLHGSKVLLPQSAIAGEEMLASLREKGADVVPIEVYRTVPAKTGGVSIQAVRDADAVTFTSPSTVRGFIMRCDGQVRLPAVCIGPTTGDEALRSGFVRVHQPETDYSLEGMLAVLSDVFERVSDDATD